MTIEFEEEELKKEAPVDATRYGVQETLIDAGSIAAPDQQEIVRAVQKRGLKPLTSKGITIESYDDLWKFAGAVIKSKLAPAGITTQEQAFVAAELGMELGLTPMMAIQNITVVHNKPSVYGDLALSLVQRSGLCVTYDEWLEDGKGNRISELPKAPGDEIMGVARTQRIGRAPIQRTFSISQAKKARLWGREGNWTTFPERMLTMRPRCFVLRDEYGDVLKGMGIAEEQADIEVAEKAAAPAEVKTVPEGVGTKRAATLLDRIGG